MGLYTFRGAVNVVATDDIVVFVPASSMNLAGATGTNVTRFPVENPIAAFGSELGGTPLYLNQNYGFGTLAGGLNEAQMTGWTEPKHHLAEAHECRLGHRRLQV